MPINAPPMRIRRMIRYVLAVNYLGLLVFGAIYLFWAVAILIVNYVHGDIPFIETQAIIISQESDHVADTYSEVRAVAVYAYKKSTLELYDPENYEKDFAKAVARNNVDLKEMDRLERETTPISEQADTQYFQGLLLGHRKVLEGVQRGSEGSVFYRASNPWRVYQSPDYVKYPAIDHMGRGMFFLIIGFTIFGLIWRFTE